MTKKEIIEKHWVKPSELYNVKAWQEAIERMMDDWAGGLIQDTHNVTSVVDVPTSIIEHMLNMFGEYKLTNDLQYDRGVNQDWGRLSYSGKVKKFIQELVKNSSRV